VFDSVANAVSGSPWTYLLLAAVCAGDAVLPVLPSETAVIAAAVLAAQGRLSIVLVVISAAVGALVGDNMAYAVGRSGLRHLADRLMKSEKSRHRLAWARKQLQHRGVWIIVVARFIPGGRTATTYVAGTVGMPWKRRFLPADGVAALLWALYSSALGYFGGAAFKNNFWLPMLIAAAASILIGACGELLRRTVLDRNERGHPARPTTES
jgi:membrane-associated protein